MQRIQAATQPERAGSMAPASHANKLHGTGGGRLFDYLVVLEIGKGPPLRQRQIDQGWTPMQLHARCVRACMRALRACEFGFLPAVLCCPGAAFPGGLAGRSVGGSVDPLAAD